MVLMGHIAMLFPRQQLVDKAQEIAKNHPSVGEVRCIKTENAVEEAEQTVKNGASIIVARGLQALRISAQVNTPIVPVRLTAQEIGLMLAKAKKMTAQNHPKIAIVVAENMVCNTDYCASLFDVDLMVFKYTTEEEYEQKNKQAIEWNPHVLIGGEHTILHGEKHKVATLFLDEMEDSLQDAIQNAQTALYAKRQTQRFTAQFDALLGSTNNGYVQTNLQGEILLMNDIICDILQCNKEEWLGRPLQNLIAGIENSAIEAVLQKGESYSTFLHIKHQAMVVIIVPVRLEDGQIDGIMLSCHKVHKSVLMDNDEASGAMPRYNLATLKFENIHQRSPKMKEAINEARLFSQSLNPVLLVGERGLERNLLAQCIHNNSVYRTGPFIHVNCGGLTQENQMDTLFGKGKIQGSDKLDLGAFGMAENGTLFLMEIDKLSPTVQYNIYRAMQYRRITQRSLEQSVHINVRLIATSETELFEECLKGNFRQDLYYLLSGLRIDLPPLRERLEDLEDIIQETFRATCTRFQRYHILTSGAKELLLTFDWQGNTLQITSFVERLVLTAKKRSVDEIFVRNLWKKMYLHTQPMQENEKAQFISVEYQRIQETLKKYNYNRGLAAKELQISTTTLWRKMKKLGLENKG